MSRSGNQHRRHPWHLVADSFNRSDTCQLIASDSFSRTNSSSLATVEFGGFSWVAQNGTWGTIGGTNAYSPVTGSSLVAGFASIATIDVGTADVDIRVTKVVNDVNGQSLIFRYVDNSNFWAIRGDNTQLNLEKVVGGVHTTLGSSFGAIIAGSVMEVMTIGSTIRCFLDGALVKTVTDTDLQTATMHGMGSQGTGQRFDTFVVNQPAYPNGLGSTDGSGLLDPQPWTVLSSGSGQVWGIASNKAKLITSAAGRTAAVVDLNPYSDIVLSAELGSSSNTNLVGVVARFTDINNYYYAYETLTGTFFGYFQSGTNNQVTGGSTTKPSVLGLRCVGNTVQVTNGHDGPVLIANTGSVPMQITQTFNNTATECGLYVTGTDATYTLDNFVVYAR